MPEEQVLFDEHIAPKVLEVIDNAKENVVIVTPWVDLWQHAKNSIEKARKNGVQVQFLIRRESGVEDKPDTRWLLDHKVRVSVVERLHAKIYLNEKSVLISSMNLRESSALNSLEVAMLLHDPADEQRVRDYVSAELMRLATPIETGLAGALKSLARKVEEATKVGHCIRCGDPTLRDPSKPLCEECYPAWAQYGNREYKEKFCHSCGKQAQVSVARPLCRTCYSEGH